MDYIQLLQKRLQGLNDNVISGFVYDEYFKLEDKITELQISQIRNHKGFDDKILNNGYGNSYAKSTQDYADRQVPYASRTKKTAGNPYNFEWGGDFIDNFSIRKKNKGIEIFSYGALSTVTAGKTEFFQSYDNMFGLNTENTSTIESEVLYYVLEKTFTRLYQ
jgi:hypothetical protein